MSAVLIHISDVHFRAGHTPKPIDRVLAAIRGLNLEPSSISLVLTGDVAYSGKPDEYKNADKYFSDLCEEISSEFRIECKVIVCPGNHDCDFPEDTAVRDLVIEKIRSSGTFPESEAMVNQCTCVQDPFFKWIGRLETSQSIPSHRLAWTTEIIAQDGTKIGFRILNTAWMSTIHEEQGNLFFTTPITGSNQPMDENYAGFWRKPLISFSLGMNMTTTNIRKPVGLASLQATLKPGYFVPMMRLYVLSMLSRLI